ncbi:MAG: alpha/beta fold hydrolase [Planctomycetota bacterium]|nr:alpha/beta hydrolase [Pirellulaceae bacterium]MEC7109882.1 alpha/beta fold hydrolase [Planctomycetota bacterium]
MPSPCKLILLHGLGSNREGMQPLADELHGSVAPEETILLEGPFDVGKGTASAFAWFTPPDDAHRALDDPKRASPSGLEKSVKKIHDQIDQFVQGGTPTNQIFLIGHSQGGAAAITAGLMYPQTLGGVIAIAGYLTLDEAMHPSVTKTPFRFHHALEDDNVSCYWADYARNAMEELGLNCQVKFWDFSENPHAIHPPQIEAISEWIRGTTLL